MDFSTSTGTSGELFERTELLGPGPDFSDSGYGSAASALGTKRSLRRVLIVEDDLPLSRFLSRELRTRLFEVDVKPDAESACETMAATKYDLILLDLNLPNMDGIQFLRSVRSMEGVPCPVLVLTARTRTEDLVAAFDDGADDCLLKPFSFLELLARIRSLLRRTGEGSVTSPVKIDTLMLNRAEHRVMRGERKIDLTPREFAILEHMMSHVGRPVSRAGLMRDVWNTAFDPSTNIVDVYMKYLRDKIDGEGEPKLIHTVRGVGYVLRNE